MNIYFFLRACVVPVAFAGWIIFQLLVRKKKFSEIEGDVKAIIFFVLVCYLIYFVLLR